MIHTVDLYIIKGKCPASHVLSMLVNFTARPPSIPMNERKFSGNNYLQILFFTGIVIQNNKWEHFSKYMQTLCGGNKIPTLPSWRHINQIWEYNKCESSIYRCDFGHWGAKNWSIKEKINRCGETHYMCVSSHKTILPVLFSVIFGSLIDLQSEGQTYGQMDRQSESSPP